MSGRDGKPKRSVGSSNTKTKYKPSEIDGKWEKLYLDQILKKAKKQKSEKANALKRAFGFCCLAFD